MIGPTGTRFRQVLLYVVLLLLFRLIWAYLDLKIPIEYSKIFNLSKHRPIRKANLKWEIDGTAITNVSKHLVIIIFCHYRFNEPQEKILSVNVILGKVCSKLSKWLLFIAIIQSVVFRFNIHLDIWPWPFILDMRLRACRWTPHKRFNVVPIST